MILIHIDEDKGKLVRKDVGSGTEAITTLADIVKRNSLRKWPFLVVVDSPSEDKDFLGLLEEDAVPDYTPRCFAGALLVKSGHPYIECLSVNSGKVTQYPAAYDIPKFSPLDSISKDAGYYLGIRDSRNPLDTKEYDRPIEDHFQFYWKLADTEQEELIAIYVSKGVVYNFLGKGKLVDMEIDS